MAINPSTGLNTSPSPIIDASKLGTNNLYNIPSPTTVSNSVYTTPINQVSAMTQASVDAQNAQNDYNNQLAQAQAKSNDISMLQSQLGGRAQDTLNTYNNTGVNKAYNELQDINAQMAGLRNEASAIPLQVQQNATGTGATDRGVAPIEAGALRLNAIKALSLGTQAALAEGNFNKAKNLADQQIAVKYSQIEADLETKKTQLESLSRYSLTPAQEKAKTALARKYEQEQKMIDEQKKNDTDLQNMIINASTQNAPADLVRRANQAKTPKEAAAVLGAYAGDYWSTKLKIAQYNKTVAESSKINSEAMAAASTVDGKAVNPAEQANFLINTVNKAMSLSGAAGASGISKIAGSALVGDTDFNRLRNQVTTLKTNLLTLATDPNIKKYFGPQMTENDVRNMMAAASTLSAEDMSPADMVDELNRVKGIFSKFQAPISTGDSAADSYYQQSSQAISGTTPLPNYGFIDNKKK
jgi:hypothetical protein